MEKDNALEQFRGKLKEIFRIDLQDLDFGIYKIMNTKKDMIENFLNKDLTSIVNSVLSEESDKENLRSQIFNLTYEFFSRYYSDGDFIPQMRYGGRNKYMIPYDGREIYLFWATKNLYYVKTTEYFYNYSFIVYDPLDRDKKYKINFKIKNASLERNYVKEEEKYFFLSDEPIEKVDDGEFNIYFEYRPITVEEQEIIKIKNNEKNNSQLNNESDQENNENIEKIENKNLKRKDIEEFLRDKIEKEILEIIQKLESNLGYILNARTEEKDININNIRKHLNIFFRKNTSDYFINKNLRDFLNNELENYIKNEILNINIKAEILDNEIIPKNNIVIAKGVFNICKKIIDEISEIEDFEKKLWEKKKFVYNVNYVITLDRIAEKEDGIQIIQKIIEILSKQKEDFIKNISKWENIKRIKETNENNNFDETDENSNNKLNKTKKTSYRERFEKAGNFQNQIVEWYLLDFIDENFNPNILLITKITGKEVNEKYKFLPIDTKYFKDIELDILSLFDDLDNELDGWLIHSENYQALNTILSKFKERIQTIYIDPPFNTGKDFLYKDNFQDSNWLTLIENRIKLANELLNESGSIYVNFDTSSNYRGRELFEEIFGKENFLNEIVWNTAPLNVAGFKTQAKNWIYAISTIYLFCKNKKRYKFKFPRYQIPKFIYNYFEYDGEDEFGKYRMSRYGEKIYIDKEQGDRIPNVWNDILSFNYAYVASDESFGFLTQKPERLLKRIIESISDEGEIVLDFFLGSGTTTAVAHKLKRKWIGVEMGEHFYTVVLPRMKKVLAYDKSGISKEEDVKEKYNENKAGGFFEYFDLEQYEDSLNNIEIKDNINNNSNTLKYILKYDAQKSKIFVNKDMLSDPFNFKMKVLEKGEEKEVNLNLIETFNLWYGIEVKRYVSKEDQGKKYIFVLGRKHQQDLIILWRNTKDLDYIKDKEFTMNVLQNEFKINDNTTEIKQVFVNNDSILDLSSYGIQVQSLNSIFFKLQWGEY